MIFNRKERAECSTSDSAITKLEELTGKLPVLEIEDKKFRQTTLTMETINKIIDAFRSAPDDEMYGEILKIVLAVMESVYGVFGYMDEKEDWICPSITRDIWEKCELSDKSVIFPREKWINFAVWKVVYNRRETAVTNDPVNVPVGHLPIKRIMITPILFNSRMIGMLAVANKNLNYVKEDQDILEQIARLISPILMARLQRDGILKKGDE